MKKSKRCPRCKRIKVKTLFNKDKLRSDGVFAYCKDCQHELQALRRTNPAWLKKHTDYNNALRKERMLRVEKLKDKPCTDCGHKFPPYCMDFDHVRGQKEFYVTESVRSWERTEKEIAKCELVCANCHRIRTYRRKQFGSGRRKR